MGARVRCPTCQREISWSEAFPHRPFCSDRCRLIDLGAWLSEQRAVPGRDAELSEGPTPGEPEETD
jgi:endogenous inhibitor of DNA gyrase (YacG/DUF329 family)